MRTTSQRGIDLIKQFEGLRLTSYLCSANVWTIGYGRTRGIRAGMTITEAQAEQFLREDIARFERAVNDLPLTLNQNQFDALVSFAFNCGQGSLRVLTTNRTHKTIAEKMLLYNKAGGQVIAGLTRRRRAEQKLFLTP